MEYNFSPDLELQSQKIMKFCLNFKSHEKIQKVSFWNHKLPLFGPKVTVHRVKDQENCFSHLKVYMKHHKITNLTPTPVNYI